VIVRRPEERNHGHQHQRARDHPRRDPHLGADPDHLGGEPVSAQTETLQAALDASLRAWLENLKREAEQRSR
jgi:hypothetical protein